MSMLISGRSDYIGKYGTVSAKAKKVTRQNKARDFLAVFTPFFWLSLFIVLTVIVKFIGG
jgi:hypothetical protein